MDPMSENFHAIIPAGGSGTRLWPLSRKDSPKFLHDVLGSGRTLLQSTWDRVAPLVEPDRTWVVTGSPHADAVRAQLPALPADRVVAEPSPRDSAAAIGLAAMLIHDKDAEAVVGSFSADHSITNAWEFRSVIHQAVAAAATGDVVTIGITPTYPSTAYGYIETGPLLGMPGAPTARRAKAFVEKPDADVARRYAYSGCYRWNAGMFIARADALLALYREHAPELYAHLRAIADAWDSDRRQDVLAEQWPQLDKIAIDYVVAEPAAAEGRVVVVPGDFGWDDVGDFDAVAKLRQPMPGEHTSVQLIGLDGVDDGHVVEVDSSGVVMTNQSKVIALVGIEGVVVVDTGDALLITARSHGQNVKKVVQALEQEGYTQTL